MTQRTQTHVLLSGPSRALSARSQTDCTLLKKIRDTVGLEVPLFTSRAWEGRERWGPAFQTQRVCGPEEEEGKVARSPRKGAVWTALSQNVILRAAQSLPMWWGQLGKKRGGAMSGPQPPLPL